MNEIKTGDLISYARRWWSPIRHVGLVVMSGAGPLIATALPWPTDKRTPRPPVVVDVVPLDTLLDCGGVVRHHPLCRVLYTHEIERLVLSLDGSMDEPVLRSEVLALALWRAAGLTTARGPFRPGDLVRRATRAGLCNSARILV